jgi:hypothetical protein
VDYGPLLNGPAPRTNIYVTDGPNIRLPPRERSGAIRLENELK